MSAAPNAFARIHLPGGLYIDRYAGQCALYSDVFVDRLALLTSHQAEQYRAMVRLSAGRGNIGPREVDHVRPADIVIVGPVDGMNEPHPEGSYFRLVVTRDGDERRESLLSRGAVEVLRNELIGALR